MRPLHSTIKNKWTFLSLGSDSTYHFVACQLSLDTPSAPFPLSPKALETIKCTPTLGEGPHDSISEASGFIHRLKTTYM